MVVTVTENYKTHLAEYYHFNHYKLLLKNCKISLHFEVSFINKQRLKLLYMLKCMTSNRDLLSPSCLYV